MDRKGLKEMRELFILEFHKGRLMLTFVDYNIALKQIVKQKKRSLVNKGVVNVSSGS